MYKIIDCFSISNNTILVLDKELPNTDFSTIIINDQVLTVTIPYDIPNSVAIQGTKNFMGSSVEFL